MILYFLFEATTNEEIRGNHPIFNIFSNLRNSLRTDIHCQPRWRPMSLNLIQ